MAGEQFSLCWDNFHSNMSSGLSSLYKTEDLVDVTLAAEGRYLKAHKMVLSVCSPYFRELFQVNPCKHPIVFLKDVSYNALSNLLEFMYQGEVKVSQDDLGTFIKTAEALKIKGLTGDGAQQNDAEAAPQPNVSSTEETPASRKSAREREREKTPPVRRKPMGPASKRIKVDTDNIPSPIVTTPQQSQPQQQQQQQPQPSQASQQQPVTEITLKQQQQNPVEQQFMHFKLEPEETAVSLTNEEDVSYDDSAMDDMGIDNSSDYLMESTTEMDSKAGTSSAMDNVDATGDNQGMYKFVVTQLGTLNLVLHQHLYRPRNTVSGKRLWNCTWKKHCPAKCISLNEKLIGKKGMHSHPPQREFIAAKESAGQVVFRKLF